MLPQFAAANLRTGVRPVATFGGGGNQNAEIQFTISGPDLKKLENFAGSDRRAGAPAAGRGRRRHLADRRQARAVGPPRPAEGGRSRRGGGRRRRGAAPARRRRPGHHLQRGGRAVRRARARPRGRTGRRRRACRTDDGAVEDARQRSAREHRDASSGHRRPERRSPQPAAAGDRLRRPAAGGVADAGDGRDDEGGGRAEHGAGLQLAVRRAGRASWGGPRRTSSSRSCCHSCSCT